MKALKVLSVAGVLGLMLAMPFVGFAQGFPTQTQTLPNITSITNIQSALVVILRIVNIIFTFLLILAIVFVLIAAYRYLTAGGDPEKIKKAHGTLIWALVAVAVAVLAIALVNIVRNSTASGLSS